MKYVFYLLFALITASFDRWLGETLIFVFPICVVYIIALENSEIFPLYYTFLYTIFYFSTRLELNFSAILFFGIFLMLNFLFKNMRMNFFKALIIFCVLSFSLSIMTKSYFSSLIGMIIMIIVYFVNMRLIVNERETS